MSYIDENRKGLMRLQTIAGSLTDAQLGMQVGDGWTIAALLAHLAFWDYRALHLLQRWKKEGVGRSPIDVDIVNDSMKPLYLAIPGREAVKLVLQAAQQADAEIESLPEELMPAIQEFVKEGNFRLDRSLHRNEHVDQIENALAAIGRK